VPYDVLRPQRLAAPVTVYIAAYSAHPLEADAAHLYGPPDGWLDGAGTFHATQPPGDATPVLVAELRPEDGLYLLPYLARQADGSAWEDVTTRPGAPAEQSRQSFYPDASRIYEEIDRFGIGGDGRPVALSSVADFDFVRAAPSGGYTGGLAARDRTDLGDGDVAPESWGEDFVGYYPFHLHREPTLATLARATNLVQDVLSSGRYSGAQWLEGSPTTEETTYWLGLLIDTPVPLVGHAAQRPHQALSADGDRNLVDGVKYLLSGAALDEVGRDRIGAVLVVDELVFAARDVAKVDARPGGYVATGGHGGVVADLGGYGPPQVTYVPARRHTWCSAVRLSVLPKSVTGVAGDLETGLATVEVATKDGSGLLPEAMPRVTMHKYGRYTASPTRAIDPPDPGGEVEILARVAANLRTAPLAGFVAEGMSPYGLVDPTTDAALTVAAFAGMPTVRVGRGNTGGMAYKLAPLMIAGNNLTATKARMLLIAGLLKFGALPPAADPYHPTAAEYAATTAAVAAYQDLFDTH